MKRILVALTLICTGLATAQNNTTYWQQEVDYQMDVDVNVDNFKYTGTQELKYTNNSPDTLNRVFYHLYFNAFQPESEMNARLTSIQDPDGRMVNNLGTRENPEYESRISKLSEDEIGFLHATSLKQDGSDVMMNEVGTVLVVDLNKPLLPGQSTTFNMEFEGQVPEQIRRAGRNSEEGISLSMSQWYPKLAEYDFEGWHADPYIAREFHGVWGDFDVKISIDKDYTVASTGYLQNPNEIGHGYEEEGTTVKKTKGDKHTWHFKAPKVHDFTWAADPDYKHDKLVAQDGTVLHFFYQDNKEFNENWEKVQAKTEELLLFFNEHIGPYPWDQYSVVQGGDGGMEYAMLTLVTGERKFESLFGVIAHEMAHAWFQHLLATNENQHEWMDEGFTSYISGEAEHEIMNKSEDAIVQQGSYRGYNYLANSGVEQPQSTHSDRYDLNFAYSLAAYSKGAVFLAQLGYLIGEENLQKTLHRYYDEWKFKHPTPNDFIRIAEKVSGAQLGWYLNDWTRTTNTIDYSVDSVKTEGGKSTISLSRIGNMAMPLEVNLTMADGSEQMHYIPLRMMYWNKEFDTDVKTEADWAWAFPTYEFEVAGEVTGVEIDPSTYMADIKRDNNVWPAASETSSD